MASRCKRVNGALAVSSDLDRCLSHLDVPLGFDGDRAVVTLHIVQCGLLSLGIDVIIPTLSLRFLFSKSDSVIRGSLELALLGCQSAFKVMSRYTFGIDEFVAAALILADVFLDVEALVNSLDDSW